MKGITKTIQRKLREFLLSLRSEKGFSLIELMIVITIIGILSIIVVPRLMDIPKKARVQAAKNQIASFGTALDRYSLDNGQYPTSEQGLDALVNKPSTEPQPMNYNPGGYLKKKAIPKDPWGRDYIYKSPGENNREYDIISLGADGKEGGEDENADVTSWE